jgi:hypothetical protein
MVAAPLVRDGRLAIPCARKAKAWVNRRTDTIRLQDRRGIIAPKISVLVTVTISCPFLRQQSSRERASWDGLGRHRSHRKNDRQAPFAHLAISCLSTGYRKASTKKDRAEPSSLRGVTPGIQRANWLVPVLGDYTWRSVHAYAVYPRPRHLSQRVRAFVDFLVKRFAGLPYWDLRLERFRAQQ